MAKPLPEETFSENSEISGGLITCLGQAQADRDKAPNIFTSNQ
jgi:hypothetical protein